MYRILVFAYHHPNRPSVFIAESRRDSIVDARSVAYKTIEGKVARYKLSRDMKGGEIVITQKPWGWGGVGRASGDSVVYYDDNAGFIVCAVFSDNAITIYKLNRNGTLGKIIDGY